MSYSAIVDRSRPADASNTNCAPLRRSFRALAVGLGLKKKRSAANRSSKMCQGQYDECNKQSYESSAQSGSSNYQTPPPPYPGYITSSNSSNSSKPQKFGKMNSLGPAAPEVRKAAQEFISFLNKSVTPFHAVAECKLRLVQAGFVELPETGHWDIQQGSKYFVTKNRSAIIAFAVGGAFVPGNGFSMVVGHTDSPCLRVKPISKQEKDKFLQVGVSTYGGGIWRTWFDRDLSVAGEVVVREKDVLSHRMININRPILFIPNLAIHLETDRDTFKCNTEEHLRPLLESYAAAGINAATGKQNGAAADPRDITGEHHTSFLDVVARSRPADASNTNCAPLRRSFRALAVGLGLKKKRSAANRSSKMCQGQYDECNKQSYESSAQSGSSNYQTPPPPYPGYITSSNSSNSSKPQKFGKMNSLGPAAPEVRKAAQEFISFLNKSVTPFHAVAECKLRLVQAGFVELPETGHWDIQQGSKYFVTKNRSAIIAFAVGGAFVPGNGFSMVVGHTDSPCLRVKPISKQEKDKFLQVGVSTYGGGIWRTWFDRDLSVAGEVVVREKDVLSHRMININRPILFIPNLAIHLETDRDTFKCNTEEHLRPLLESYAAAGINAATGKQNGAAADPRDITGEHHTSFLDVVASAAGVDKTALVDMDLYLYDQNPAAITGLNDEFICGARLDNLVGTYTAISGLLESLSNGSLSADTTCRMALCFDNEEVGSNTAMGAASSLTEYVLRRLSAGGSTTAFEEAIAKSLLISADQAHAAHPNYPAKHEENHRPTFHGGVVVKVNVNQKYATTATTHAVLKQVASEAGVPLQKMIVRNDSPCGSTVGPILATRLGLQTVDVGCPQLAMHSIREFGDTSSIWQATKLYSTFFQRLPTILSSFK